jgi:DNA-binding transcriptional regulator YiaG
MASRELNWDCERVKALRQHLRLTQSKMAEQLGTRQQTISEWEIGLYQPRGTSTTLLSIIAERSAFIYQPNTRDANRK